MEPIFKGIVIGVMGTLIMDLLNHGFAQIRAISKIDVRIIGRMAAGWPKGRFRYSHPDEMECLPNEMVYGYLTHYAIGIGLAIPFVLGWHLRVGGPVSPIWAFVYGVATTVASLFYVYPSMGFGMLGLRSPEGHKSPLSSLANHTFFGVGMAVAVALV
jgi:Protein of unknown function (DUF2938)